MKYRTSKYNYFCTINGEEYVYNTFSGALSKLNKEAKEFLERKDIIDDSESLDKDIFYNSVKNGFVVKDDFDETEVLNYYRTNSLCQETTAMYEILPTTACNARCFYCFENGTRFVTMTKETANKVCDFICKNVPNKKDVLIRWFGGEPLMAKDIITYITKQLDERLVSKGIPVYYQLTTNGSLIRKEELSLYKDVWKITDVQITLDGTKKIYEDRKSYINVPNSFETVVNNINLLSNNGIRVSIRLNYDKDNIDDLMELIDYLGVTVKGKVSAYVYPLFGIEGVPSPDQKEVAVQIIRLSRKLVENGLSKGSQVLKPHFVLSKCYACMRNGFLINPEGKLGKCSLAMGEGDFFGNIDSPLRLNNNYLKWCSTNLPSDECSTCKFLPLCQGGCKAGHLGYGTVKHYIFKNCFDEVLKEIVDSL